MTAGGRNPGRTPMRSDVDLMASGELKGLHIIRRASELAPQSGKVCLALGMFDGVHLGHQQVLHQTVRLARQHGGPSVALTFDRHPNTVVAPERTPPLIYSLPQRLRAIHSLGIDTILLVHFDTALSRQPGEDFISALVRDFGGVHSICIGHNFSFGYQRSGNVTLLQRLGEKLGFAVHAEPAFVCAGKTISSTRIRESIQLGDLELAGRMLGRTYSIAGRVVAGEQLGRKLGFPTANLDVAGLVLPPLGVYAGHAQLAGERHRAVINLGYRPTLRAPLPELRVEVHLLQFQRDLYGAELEFEFVKRLRGEQKFGSMQELREQIGRDVAAAPEWLGGPA